MVDIAAAIEAFRAAARARGLDIPDQPQGDGKLHRCPLIDGPRNKLDGAYLLHLDGIPAGGFENHKDAAGWSQWHADISRQLTPAEAAANRARMEAQRAEREAEIQARRSKARKKAHGIFNGAKPAPDDHPYLVRKRVASFGLKVCTWTRREEIRPGEWKEVHIPNTLLVPVRNSKGTLHSLQAIYPEKISNRDKEFLSNGLKQACFHLIGEIIPDQPLCIAEGYATAASLHQVSDWPTAVAFDAGSLQPVARALQEAYPQARFILCADDDAFGHCQACKAPVRVADGDTCPSCGQPHKCRNAGQIRAHEAARAVGGVVALPEFADPEGRWVGYQESGKAPTDFNDLATSTREGEGPAAVRRILEAAAAALPALQGDDAPVDVPTPAPDVESVASAPETAPAPPADDVAKPAKRARTKGKGKAGGVQTPAQGGELFELRDGNEGRGVYRLKVERRGEGWEQVEQFICAPLEITHLVRDSKGEGWCRLATFQDH
ncbi:toprim domain-containing protein, partial [Zoogloea sp. LCSB751]|uniref:toprim domain-containing protein n=1 Tax=Zoogloea sp. LCSB751 TaxID=1965277 RepID=UPI0011166533